MNTEPLGGFERGWTAPITALAPCGPWALPVATVWRPGPVGLEEPESSLGPAAATTMVEWLSELGPSVTLHVSATVGGEQPCQAWIGLSAHAASVDRAACLVEQHAADIGHLLDAWGWASPASPRAPSQAAGRVLWVEPGDDRVAGLPAVRSGGEGFHLPAALAALAGAESTVSARLDVTPRIGDTGLYQQADTLLWRAMERHPHLPLQNRLFAQRVYELALLTAACDVRLALGGLPPAGRAVPAWLAGTLNHDLGYELALRPTETTFALHRMGVIDAVEMLLCSADGVPAVRDSPVRRSSPTSVAQRVRQRGG